MVDIFLNGFWSKYIHALWAIPSNDWDLWNLYSSTIFPKITKCEFIHYGSSGSIVRKDLLCLLPLNILNEKIFAFLYVWYVLIATLAAVNILYRIATMLSKNLRVYVLRSKTRSMPVKKVRVALERCSIADWFMLIKVGSNANPVLFEELLKELYKENREEPLVSTQI